MLKTLIAVSALIVAVPAIAQNTAPSQKTSKVKDPNKVVCEKVETIGSRIASKRICLTVAQWEEQKRIDREALQHAQQNTGHASSN